MRDNKKGALELSGTFIIILTISIFALIFGLVFLVRVWNSANQMKNVVSGNAKQVLISHLASGGKGEIYPKTIFFSKQNFVNLGIRNLFNSPVKFNVSVNVIKAPNSVTPEVLIPTPVFTLNANETKIISIMFKHKKGINFPFNAIIDVEAKVNGEWLNSSYYIDSIKVYK